MLKLSCTHGEYLAASPEDQRDFNQRLLESWRQRADRAEARDYALDAEEDKKWF